MKERPEFLNRKHENGRTIVSDFKALSTDDRHDVETWLIWANCYGAMTWQENRLLDYCNNCEDI